MRNLHRLHHQPEGFHLLRRPFIAQQDRYLVDAQLARGPQPQVPAKQAKPAAGARERSKAGKVPGLLRRPDGASLKELMKATGWLAHSVRGYLSGAVAKRMRFKLVSAKTENGARRYSVRG
jgi:hypothetical protein